MKEEISASRTLPTATSTGKLRHAAKSAMFAMHNRRMSGTISSQVGPSQIAMIGWAIKACIIHFGGNSVYRKVAPLMIGGICGEILGALVPSITAAIYYAITHEIPKAFFVMLG